MMRERQYEKLADSFKELKDLESGIESVRPKKKYKNLNEYKNGFFLIHY